MRAGAIIQASRGYGRCMPACHARQSGGNIPPRHYLATQPTLGRDHGQAPQSADHRRSDRHLQPRRRSAAERALALHCRSGRPQERRQRAADIRGADRDCVAKHRGDPELRRNEGDRPRENHAVLDELGELPEVRGGACEVPRRTPSGIDRARHQLARAAPVPGRGRSDRCEGCGARAEGGQEDRSSGGAGRRREAQEASLTPVWSGARLMSELCFISATELVAHYRKRSLSPVEVTRAVLARIEALNLKVNAYCLIDAQSALDDARASEGRWMRGAPAGPIDGVPTSIKDLILTRNWPTLRGSRAVDPAGPWHDDSPATARLRESGAVLLGKTCTPEYGWKGVTDSALTGITRNPWNLERTPGGSSGGAGAQLAAGMGQLAVGTDGGGSIRIPSSFTGASGIKANFGRVPAWPLSPMGTVAHVGPMARTIDDCALLLNVLAQPDPRDCLALPYDGTDWTRNLDDGVKGLRVAYSARLGYVRYVHPDVDACVAAAANVFVDLGEHVMRVGPWFSDCIDTFWIH